MKNRKGSPFSIFDSIRGTNLRRVWERSCLGIKREDLKHRPRSRLSLLRWLAKHNKIQVLRSPDPWPACYSSLHDPCIGRTKSQTWGKPGQTGQYLEFCKAQTIEAWCTRVLVLLYMVFFSFFLVEPALHVRNGKTVETGKSRITTEMSTLWCTSGFFSWWWWIFC